MSTDVSRRSEKRRYRNPIVRVKRPAETATLGAGVLVALVSGLGLDGAGVDPTTWMTVVVGFVPFIVSSAVDFLRERKEDRESRADLAERLVLALETLADGGQVEGRRREEVSPENAMGVLKDLLIDVTDDSDKETSSPRKPARPRT
jgi:hypothetical protein